MRIKAELLCDSKIRGRGVEYWGWNYYKCKRSITTRSPKENLPPTETAGIEKQFSNNGVLSKERRLHSGMPRKQFIQFGIRGVPAEIRQQ
jgi:hypothetical protein